MAQLGPATPEMGPAYVKVYTNKMDGSVFVEYFPDELTNTDFFRRVLAQVGYSLQAFVEAIVRAHGLVVVGEARRRSESCGRGGLEGVRTKCIGLWGRKTRR